jgi:aminoglycoside 3-N-acetyltransferase
MIARVQSVGAIEPAATRSSGSSVSKRLKHRLKTLYFRGQRAVARTVFAYSPEALESAIRSLGIGPGDSVFLHSGFKRTSGFAGTAGDVIDRLLNVIGPEGHLLMMSIPYRGSSQRYAESDAVFDVLRTPSAVGLISEIFRRREGVLRSINPLHPVLARGPLAAWLTTDHEKAATSCGRGSPFERFLTLDGTFLFFDAPFSSLTFMHYVEDCFRERLPVALYDPKPASVRVRDASGVELAVRQFYFSQEARTRRNFAPVEQALLRAKTMQTARIGNSRLLRVSARSVLECARRLVDEGRGFYR